MVVKDLQTYYSDFVSKADKLTRPASGIFNRNLSSSSLSAISSSTAAAAATATGSSQNLHLVGGVADRRKMFFIEECRTFSHHEEVGERLSFIRCMAQLSSHSHSKVSKVQLGVIYDLLSNSAIKSDLNEFYLWCKHCCCCEPANNNNNNNTNNNNNS